MIALGEVLTPRKSTAGLRFDDVLYPLKKKNTNSNSEFLYLGTPIKVFQQVYGMDPNQATLQLVQSCAFLACIPMAGSENNNLVRLFQEKLNEILKNPDFRTHFWQKIYEHNKHIFSLENNIVATTGVQERKINIKEYLLDPITRFIQILSIKNKLPVFLGQAALTVLQKRKIIHPILSDIFEDYLSFVLSLRARAHLHYKTERDDLYLENTNTSQTDPALYYLSDRDRADFEFFHQKIKPYFLLGIEEESVLYFNDADVIERVQSISYLYTYYLLSTQRLVAFFNDTYFKKIILKKENANSSVAILGEFLYECSISSQGNSPKKIPAKRLSTFSAEENLYFELLPKVFLMLFNFMNSYLSEQSEKETNLETICSYYFDKFIYSKTRKVTLRTKSKLDRIIAVYFERNLQNYNTIEEYQKKFWEVTCYLLDTRASLEMHRYYYHRLPKDNRETSLIFVKNLAEQARVHQDKCCLHWPTDEMFYAKLWDAPLPDGRRLSHAIKKQVWEQKFTKTFLAEDNKNQRIQINRLSITRKYNLKQEIVSALITHGWMEKRGNFIQKEKHPIASRMPGNHLVIPWPLPEQKEVDQLLALLPTKPYAKQDLKEKEEEINLQLLELIQKNAQFYLKVFPEYPLVEFFVNDFIARLGYYTPRNVDLWLWKYGEHEYPVLVSEAVPGLTLSQALLQPSLSKLNTYAYSQAVFVNRILGLEDVKPDNIIFKVENIEGDTARFCLVDADRWFVSSFKKDGELRAKDVVICFNQMKDPIDSLFIADFLCLNPQKLLISWVGYMKTLGAQTNALFGSKIKVFFDKNRDLTQKTLLLPPLKFSVINELFTQFQTLRDKFSLIAPDTYPTHFDLLAVVDLRLAKHYFVHFNGSVLERFDKVVGSAYKKDSVLGQAFNTSRINFKEQQEDLRAGLDEITDIQAAWERDITDVVEQASHLSESKENLLLIAQQLLRGELQSFEELPRHLQEKILEDFDFDKIPNVTHQQVLLRVLLKRGQFTKLYLFHCQLDNSELNRLIQKSPKLKTLYLSNCPNITVLPDFSNDTPLKHLALKNISIDTLGYFAPFIFLAKKLVFPNLSILSIQGCPQLKSVNLATPLLSELIWLNNPLASFELNLTSLEKIQHDVTKLPQCLETFYTQKKLELTSLKNPILLLMFLLNIKPTIMLHLELANAYLKLSQIDNAMMHYQKGFERNFSLETLVSAEKNILSNLLWEVMEMSRINLRFADVASKAATLFAQYLQHPFQGFYQDLSFINLPFVNFSGANLSFANLENADLTEASLSNSNISASSFFRTNLKGVWFDSFKKINLEETVNAVCFSQDKAYLAAASGNDIFLYLKKEGEYQLKKAFKGHTSTVWSVHFSHDAKYLASASADKTIILWDVKAQKQMARLEGHTSSVNSIHFSHDAKLLASGSHDNTIILWDVGNQTPSCKA